MSGGNGHGHRPSSSAASSSQAQAAQQYASRFASAAASAAQPLLGYLSGHATGAEIDVAAVHARGSSGSTITGPAAAENPSLRRRGSLDEDARKKEMRNLDSIISQFFAKSAQVITQARLTHHAGGSESRDDASTSRGSGFTSGSKRNRWFNLELDESDIFKEELKTWKAVTALLQPSPSTSATPDTSSSSRESSIGGHAQIPSMSIDVLLDVSEMSGNQVLVLTDAQGKRSRVDLAGKSRQQAGHTRENSPKRCNILLERWTISLKPPIPTSPPELPSVYKHCIILFRALYTLVKALPAFELHRKLKRRKGHPELKIGCRISAPEWDDSQSSDAGPSEETAHEIGLDESLGEDTRSSMAQDFGLAPIVTPVGSLHLRCQYRSEAQLNVEEIEALLSSRFIDEDFFKPTMRKYSSSLGNQRPHFGSPGRPSSRLSTSPSAAPPPYSEDGAFSAHSRSGGAQDLPRMSSGTPPAVGATDLARRPSIGGSHPFKGPSSYTQPATRPLASTPPRDSSLHPRLASSPASGPSSSLRYTYGYAQTQPAPLSPISAGPPGSSQLSYTKRTVPSPTSMQPPVSALSAMQITPSSPRPASPVPAQGQTQPLPMAQPGSSGVPMSSSPTPSLIKRYSSSKYSRSFGRDSSSSSPGEHGSYWPADSTSRRSRLSSTTSREGTSAAPATRQLGALASHQAPVASASPATVAASPGDADDIRSFLGLIDSRAQLPSNSMLLRGSSSNNISLGSSPSRTSAVTRLALEERMRSLADSVYRDQPPAAPAARLSSAGAMRIASYSSRYSRSGGNSPSPSSLPGSGEYRGSPSPDLQAPSPTEGGEQRPAFLSTGSGSVRQRASQAPISTSIPEEDLPLLPASHSRSSSTAHLDAPSASGSGHFPFPRYVSSSMRRRESGTSSASGRPSIIPSPIATAASSAIMPLEEAGQHEQVRQSMDSAGSGYSPRPSEDAEEQTMGQLELGSASDYARQ